MSIYVIIFPLNRQKWDVIMSKQKSCKEYIKELGRRIKLYRIMRDMSQQDLADKTGISQRSISRLEQGESVQLNSLVMILIALDLCDNLEVLVPDQTKRPSFYLEKSENVSRRVRRKNEKKTFKRGDEK